MNRKLISILVPCYNEEEVIEIFYKEIYKHIIDKFEGKYDFEIFFINDGSKDFSLKVMKDLRKIDKRVSYLNLSRNYGKEMAMLAGFDYIESDAVVIMDVDLQDPPELVIDMIKYWEIGFDDVYAKRRSRNSDTFLKKITATIYYKILNIVSEIPILENTGDFRLLSKRAVIAIKKYREYHRYTKGYFTLIGFSKKEILYDRQKRVAGSTKWNYFKLFDLAIEGITSFTAKPLRFSTAFGIIVSLFGFIYMLYIILKTVVFGDVVPGYPSLISIILFFSGIQLLSLGIIGEYLGRIFYETKNRPLYFIDEYNEVKWDGEN